MKKHRLLILGLMMILLSGYALGQPQTDWLYEYGTSADEICNNSAIYGTVSWAPDRIIIVGQQEDNGTTGYYVVTDMDGVPIAGPTTIGVPDKEELLLAACDVGPRIDSHDYCLFGTTKNVNNLGQLWVVKFDEDDDQLWSYVNSTEESIPLKMDARLRYWDANSDLFDIGAVRATLGPTITSVECHTLPQGMTSVASFPALWTPNRVRAVDLSATPSEFLVAGHTIGVDLRAAYLDATWPSPGPVWQYELNESGTFASDVQILHIINATNPDVKYGVVGGKTGLILALLDEDGDEVELIHFDSQNQPAPVGQAAVLTEGFIMYEDELFSFIAVAYQLPNGSTRLLLFDHNGNIAVQHDITETGNQLIPKFIHVTQLNPLEINVGGYKKDNDDTPVNLDFWQAKVSFGNDNEYVALSIAFASCPFWVGDGGDGGSGGGPGVPSGDCCLESPCGLVIKRDFLPTTPLETPVDSIVLWWPSVPYAHEYVILGSDDSELSFSEWDVLGVVSTTTWKDYWDPADVGPGQDKIRFYAVQAKNITFSYWSGMSNMVGAYEFYVGAGTPSQLYYQSFGLPFKFWHLDEDGIPIYEDNNDGPLYESFEPSEIIGSQINPGGPVNSDKVVKQGGSQAYIRSDYGYIWVDPLEESETTGIRMIPGEAYWIVNKSGAKRIIIAGQVDNMGFYTPKLIQAPTSTPSWCTNISFRDARFLGVNALGFLDDCDQFLGGNILTSDILAEQEFTGTAWKYIGAGDPVCEGDGTWQSTNAAVISPGRAYWIFNKHQNHSWNYAWPYTADPICEPEEEE